MKTLPVLLAASVVGLAPAPSCAQERGTVEGTVSLRLAAPKKWAPRYPGSGGTSAEVQPVRAVVYLEGDLPPARGPRETVSLSQEGGRFVPGAVAVVTGTVVRFPNADPYYHNVYSYSGPRFDLGRYPPGDSREVAFDRPGIVHVHCEIHEHMRAVVLVTDHPYHAVVSEDGTFLIGDVPPGSYTLSAFHPDLGMSTLPVTVRAGGRTRVDVELGR